MAIVSAGRLKGLQEYYFSRKLVQLRQLGSSGEHVINLGIGSPDQPPAHNVIKVLNTATEDATIHGYQAYQGIPELRRSLAAFYKRKFCTTLYDNHFLPMMGSKEAITHISMAFLDKGDEVLIPSLAYPTYSSVTCMVEAKPVYYPLLPHKNWHPDWEFLATLDTSKTKIIWINYPHMPTGASGNLALFERWVQFARERDLLLCHDNPYAFILNESPTSVFQVDGALEWALELGSMSKTFNMAGWRIGWVAGKEDYLGDIMKIKSNMDSGMFKPIQLAACEALKLDDNWFHQVNATYNKRKIKAYALLNQLKCKFTRNQAGMFIWAKVPGSDGEKLSDEVLKRHKIFLTPGFIFGEQGRSYIRISLCSPEKDFEEALHRIK